MSVAALAWWLLSSAHAAPVTLTHAARVLDADGAPRNGAAAVALTLWDAESGGDDFHTETHPVSLADGYFQVVLGGAGDLDAAEIPAAGAWVEVAVDGVSLGRQPVGFVPLAAVAQRVQGGAADVSELRVGGVSVVDGARDLSVTAATVDGALHAGSAQVDDSLWVTGPITAQGESTSWRALMCRPGRYRLRKDSDATVYAVKLTINDTNYSTGTSNERYGEWVITNRYQANLTVNRPVAYGGVDTSKSVGSAVGTNHLGVHAYTSGNRDVYIEIDSTNSNTAPNGMACRMELLGWGLPTVTLVQGFDVSYMSRVVGSNP
jgi:hypothetical protein